MPENASGFVAGIDAERVPRAGVEEVHEAAVVGLLEMVKRFADEQVQVELAAQGAKLAAAPAVCDGFGNAKGTAKAGDDSADSGDFHLRGGVADQIDAPRADAALDRNPAGIHRNFRALKGERGEAALVEKCFEAAASLLTLFADESERALPGRIGNQPIKIRRVPMSQFEAR